MARRNYDQSCSLALALDRIGERWALLIIRELSLGPLRFSDLARAVGGAPTDVLARRLRDLEADRIVRRRELPLPASGVAYELTELGRELERPMLELSRWGMNYYDLEDATRVSAAMIANALRVLIVPSPEMTVTFLVRSGGHDFSFEIEKGWVRAERGLLPTPDLTVTGEPVAILAMLASGSPGADREAIEAAAAATGAQSALGQVEVEGDIAVLEALQAAIQLPESITQAQVSTR